VKSAGFWVDIVLNGVGAEDMGGEGIKLRRRVSEKVGESNGREWVGIGMVCRVSENHCRELSRLLVEKKRKV
jgi:hypothetical protein